MAESITAERRTAAGSQAARPVVIARGLTKTFRDFWLRPRAKAVDHIDFDINPGEIFGLLGPNGSGKSTTIKMLLGLLKKTSGRLAVFGKAPDDVSIKKRIGYLPEESYLYPYLNARETLDYYAKLFQLDPKVRARRIDELLDMVGLTAVQHRQVREYSKGMQRRIGLAQALINDPEFLVLDEPTTGLDPIGTRQVKDLIIELGRRGKTILLSSHQLSDVEDVVDRTVILYGGRIRASGTCDDLLAETSRSVIETEALDDETIAEITRILEARHRRVQKVSPARQRLEDLFVDLVEQARQERLENAGATHGGTTAAFLAQPAPEAQREGGELIEDLVSTTAQEPPETEPSPGERANEADQADSDAGGVIDDLLGTDEEQPDFQEPSTASASETTAPDQRRPTGSDVDDDVIGSLLDNRDDDQRRDDEGPTR